jgi:hypothetical protein
MTSSFPNFLDPDQCLVHLINQRPFGDAEGYTHVARKLREYIQGDKLWADLLLQTTDDGELLVIPSPITVSGDRIVSDRAFHDITPRRIYHFAPLTNLSPTGSNFEYPIQARGFVIKSNQQKPLEATSRSALGSGVFGIYLKSEDLIDEFRTAPNQTVYAVECPLAYPIQDKEHGDSLSVASLNTNRYLDRVINAARDETVRDFNAILTLIRDNPEPRLYTLWNIALYRTEDYVGAEELTSLLAQYVVSYYAENSALDSVNGAPLHELPINGIMRYLGYQDGVIASDLYNNGWDRGGVWYNYKSVEATIQGETARYRSQAYS